MKNQNKPQDLIKELSGELFLRQRIQESIASSMQDIIDSILEFSGYKQTINDLSPSQRQDLMPKLMKFISTSAKREIEKNASHIEIRMRKTTRPLRFGVIKNNELAN